MELKKSGSQPSGKGPEEYFTGNVRIDPLMQAAEPARNSCALVTFEPVEGVINDQIDDACRAKYHSSPYLSPMIGARARARSGQGHTAREQRLIAKGVEQEEA